jgi:hypothetical protein
MRKRAEGITRPPGENVITTTYSETPDAVRVTLSSEHGRKWTAEVGRAEGLDRINIASRCAMDLHLDYLGALAVADEVLRRLAAASVASP